MWACQTKLHQKSKTIALNFYMANVEALHGQCVSIDRQEIMKPIVLVPGGGKNEPSQFETSALVQVMQAKGWEVHFYQENDLPWEDAKGITSFLTANNITECHLIGCSLGGNTVVEWAKHYHDHPAVKTITTVDAPLLALRPSQDAYWRFWYTISLGVMGQMWSGSSFMKKLRNDPWPISIVTGFQWLNDDASGFIGNMPGMSQPFPHLKDVHWELFGKETNWDRVLGLLD